MVQVHLLPKIAITAILYPSRVPSKVQDLMRRRTSHASSSSSSSAVAAASTAISSSSSSSSAAASSATYERRFIASPIAGGASTVRKKIVSKTDAMWGTENAAPPTESVTVLSSAEIEPCDDPQACVDSIMTTSSSEEWLTQYACMDSVRQLAIHHSAMLKGCFRVVIPILRKGVQSLRSAQCRNALLALSEVYSNCARDELMFEIEETVSEVMRKCVNDLRFISNTAKGTLSAITEAMASEELFNALLKYTDDKNVKMCATAADCAMRCLKRVGKARVGKFNNVGNALVRVYQFETGRSVHARKPAQAMFRFFAAALGGERFEACAKESLPPSDFARVRGIALKKAGQRAGRAGKPSLKEIMAQKRREMQRGEKRGDVAVHLLHK